MVAYLGETAITAPSSDSVTEMNDSAKDNWWQRLTGGLKRTSSALGGAIADLVTKRKLDAATIAEIKDVLIRADLGLDTAARIAAALGEGRYEAGDRRRGQGGGGRRDRKGAHPGRAAARDRCGKKAVRHPGRRRQRLRQDHDHRQARGEIPRRRPRRDAGGRRHVSRRRHRSAQNLGRAHRRRDSSRAKRAPMPPVSFSMPARGERARRRRAARRYRRPPAEPHRIDGGAAKGRPRDEEGRSAAPHAVLLVLDATVGQNALSQVEIFRKVVGVTGSS
jgi:fused signal recognition particle receptor